MAVTLSVVASGRPTVAKQAVGRRLADARRRAGLTQKELAEELGVNLKSVQAWEGGRASPYRRVDALERVLAIDRNWLMPPPAEFPEARMRADARGLGATERLLFEHSLASVEDRDQLEFGHDILPARLRRIEHRLADIERRLETLEAQGRDS